MQQRFGRPERRPLLLLQARRVHLRQQPVSRQLAAVRMLVESIEVSNEDHLLRHRIAVVVVVAVGVEASVAAKRLVRIRMRREAEDRRGARAPARAPTPTRFVCVNVRDRCFSFCYSVCRTLGAERICALVSRTRLPAARGHRAAPTELLIEPRAHLLSRGTRACCCSNLQ